MRISMHHLYASVKSRFLIIINVLSFKSAIIDHAQDVKIDEVIQVNQK